MSFFIDSSDPHSRGNNPGVGWGPRRQHKCFSNRGLEHLQTGVSKLQLNPRLEQRAMHVSVSSSIIDDHSLTLGADGVDHLHGLLCCVLLIRFAGLF